MGYSGGSLSKMVAGLDRASMRAGRAMAENMGAAHKKHIRENTPVETEKLRKSYRTTKVKYGIVPDAMMSLSWSAKAWYGKNYTEIDYAPPMEYGSGLWGPKHMKFKIAPKKPGGVLAFGPYSRTATGKVILNPSGAVRKDGSIIVSYVMHPGSPGHAMFRIGALVTEHNEREWSAEPMRRWREEVEASMRAQK